MSIRCGAHSNKMEVLIFISAGSDFRYWFRTSDCLQILGYCLQICYWIRFIVVKSGSVVGWWWRHRLRLLVAAGCWISASSSKRRWYFVARRRRWDYYLWNRILCGLLPRGGWYDKLLLECAPHLILIKKNI